MAIALSDITTKIRYLLGDISTTTTDAFTYTSSNIFTLTEDNAIAITTVFLNNSDLGASEVSFDSSTNKVTVSLTMISGDTVEVQYTYYPNYSDTLIEAYIRAALIHISTNNYKSFIEEATYIFPEPNTREQNLISLIAGLLIEPDNKTYRLPDLSMVVPKDLPTHSKISKFISIFKKDSHGVFDVL